MTNIIIHRDRARATASVYLDGYPARPTWEERYRGPVWKPGDFNGIFANAAPHYPNTFLPGGGYGGFSNARLEQMGNTILVLESVYDTQCLDVGDNFCLPDVTLMAYSHVTLDTIFLVSDGDASVGLEANFPPGPGQETKFILYNWTDGEVVTISENGTFSLYNRHVYRLKALTHAEGYGDLTAAMPSSIQIRFIDAVIKVPGAPDG